MNPIITNDILGQKIIVEIPCFVNDFDTLCAHIRSQLNNHNITKLSLLMQDLIDFETKFRGSTNSLYDIKYFKKHYNQIYNIIKNLLQAKIIQLYKDAVNLDINNKNSMFLCLKKFQLLLLNCNSHIRLIDDDVYSCYTLLYKKCVESIRDEFVSILDSTRSQNHTKDNIYNNIIDLLQNFIIKASTYKLLPRSLKKVNLLIEDLFIGLKDYNQYLSSSNSIRYLVQEHHALYPDYNNDLMRKQLFKKEIQIQVLFNRLMKVEACQRISSNHLQTLSMNLKEFDILLEMHLNNYNNYIDPELLKIINNINRVKRSLNMIHQGST